jgi:hypothetical protein
MELRTDFKMPIFDCLFEHCNRMKSARNLLIIFLIVPTLVFSQAKSRRLGTPINHPSVNVYAPLISADGNVMVFVSDNAEDNVLTPFFSVRENNDWIEPFISPKNIYSRSNFLYGYGLSADGKKLYLSTLKPPGVGGYDLWTADMKGKTFTEPQNMGAPINTRQHEACASITPDGNTLYFMRCEKMDRTRAENCKLFSVKKLSNGRWDVPIELPANVNTGNSQTPRIMADGETLFFSSDKIPGGKGGMDLYVTRLKDNTWTDPVPLDFLNTDKDDQYVSANALGRYLMRDVVGSRKNEIVEFLIPDNLRPKGMMKLDGTVKDADGKPVAAYLAVTNITTNQRLFNGRPNADGSYLIYLMEGYHYEVSIDPEQSNYNYVVKEFDLSVDKIPQATKYDAILKPVQPGDEFLFALVRFKPGSSVLDPNSFSELQRFARVAKNNAALKFEVQVLLNGYLQDSIRSSEDLTEMQVDSIQTQYDEIDSLGQLYKKDTVIARITYHNDRTSKQAAAIVGYLATQGVDTKNFSVFVNAIPAVLPENRKLTIKARVR